MSALKPNIRKLAASVVPPKRKIALSLVTAIAGAALDIGKLVGPR